VGSLLAGTEYQFKVRARNKTGQGPWSPVLRLRTAAAPPDPPRDVQCVCASQCAVRVSWLAPEHSHGAPVAEFRVQQASRKYAALFPYSR